MKPTFASGTSLILGLGLLLAGCTLWRAVAQQPAITPAPTDPALAIFYSGMRSSTLEPCGCHTRQQGGLQLEASMYENYKGIAQLRLEAGGWTSPVATRVPTEPLKTAFLLRGLMMMNFDAVNVGLADVQLSNTWYEELKGSHPEALAKLISANVFRKDKPTEHAFPTEMILERKLQNGQAIKIGITGVASVSNISSVMSATPQDKPNEVQTTSFIIKDPQPELAAEVAKLRSKVDLLIVLYAGEFNATFDMAQKNPQIDVIVTTARNIDQNTVFMREGRALLLMNPGPQGKEIGLLTVKQAGPQAWEPVGQGEKVIISKEFAMEKQLTGLVEEYKRATQAIAAEMPPPNAEQLYAGDDKCITCHLQFHNQWRGTPHAHAMQTLVERNQQFNPDCVKCHVTGYKTANGFWHITDAHSQLYMSNVQCEVCHGPAMQHVNDQQTLASGAEKWMKPAQFAELKKKAVASMPKTQVSAKLCLECHTAVTDPDFNFEKKVVKINHSKPYTPDPGEDTGKMHGMDKSAKEPAAKATEKTPTRKMESVKPGAAQPNAKPVAPAADGRH